MKIKMTDERVVTMEIEGVIFKGCKYQSSWEGMSKYLYEGQSLIVFDKSPGYGDMFRDLFNSEQPMKEGTLIAASPDIYGRLAEARKAKEDSSKDSASAIDPVEAALHKQ